MTYTIENIPDDLEQALQQRAAAEKKSVDAVLLDAVARGLGVEPRQSVKPGDLSDIAGTWEEDSETEAILEEQNRIDPEMWK